MKKSFLFIIVFSSCHYAFANSVSLLNDTLPVKTEVSKEGMLADLKFLIKSPKARYDKNIERLDQCAQYIFDEFKKLTDSVSEQKYFVGKKEYKNVICSFGSTQGERIIVGAHYDVCEDQPGADDNASGVAGLLEIARLLKEQSNLKYRIDLVAYTLEEPPNFRTANMGSAVHAKMLHDNNIKVKTMICLEMIGYYSDKKGSQEYPIGLMKLFYPRKANFIAVIGKTGQGKTAKRIRDNINEKSLVRAISLNAPASLPGIDFSDHLNYWKYGYKAVMITDTSFYRNANYHERSDTLETLDLDKMAEVVKGVFNSIIQIK